MGYDFNDSLISDVRWYSIVMLGFSYPLAVDAA
jgi:hypothetical protein